MTDLGGSSNCVAVCQDILKFSARVLAILPTPWSTRAKSGCRRDDYRDGRPIQYSVEALSEQRAEEKTAGPFPRAIMQLAVLLGWRVFVKMEYVGVFLAHFAGLSS